MAVSTVRFTLNGQSYDLSLDSSSGTYKAVIIAPSASSYSETDHKFYGTVTAEDEAGNSVTATKDNFPELGLRVLEKTAPVISVWYPTAAAYIVSATPTVEWEVTDAGSGIDITTLALKIDNGSTITTGFTTTEIEGGYHVEYTPGSALDDGEHTIYFNVSDNDGNAATQESVTFTIDTAPPVLVVVSPEDGLITNQTTIPVNGTTNDVMLSSVSLTVNGNAVSVNENGEWGTTVSLTEGNNTITVVSTDAAGQSTTIVRTVTLDTVAPVITAITLTPNPVDAGQTFVITVTVTD